MSSLVAAPYAFTHQHIFSYYYAKSGADMAASKLLIPLKVLSYLNTARLRYSFLLCGLGLLGTALATRRARGRTLMRYDYICTREQAASRQR
jgi:hypothetical protein